VSFGETSYLAIAGPSAVFDGENTTRRDDIPDGPSNTIMVAESVGSGTCWLAPVDLDFQQMPLTVNGRRKGGICSGHVAGGARVLMADGTVHRLPNHLSAEMIEALITVGGGESVSPKDIAQR
jgi:hypothetical protein